MGSPQAVCGECGGECYVQRLGKSLKYIINCPRCMYVVAFSPMESVIYGGISLMDALEMNADARQARQVREEGEGTPEGEEEEG